MCLYLLYHYSINLTSKLYIYSLCRTARPQGMGNWGSPPLGRGRRCHRHRQNFENDLGLPKLHSFKGFKVGVPNGKKNKQYPKKWWSFFWRGENYVQSSKLFIVELEMSRLWQHFAASVMNSVSGVPSHWVMILPRAGTATGRRGRRAMAVAIEWSQHVQGARFLAMDWFKGKSTGNHGFYHQI